MPEFKRSLAVVIGINQYVNGIPELKTAVNDANKLALILEKNYQYQVLRLLDEDATKDKLTLLLAAFEEQTLPFPNGNKIHIEADDRFLFYFAGHGFAQDGLDNAEPVGFIVPQDGRPDEDTWLSMQRLHDALIKLPCRHLLIILDCCFAGTFRWAGRDREMVRSQKVYRERYDRFIAGCAQQVITSAASDEKAADSLYRFGQRGEHQGHSPFAELLFQALSGEADFTNDEVITATELYVYLRDKITSKQTPEICQLKRHDKGEYIFPLQGFDRNLLEEAPALDEKTNPYKGLMSFEEADSDKFFGRKALTQKLQEFVTTHQLTVVLGASGSGKSSLVKAGLIPQLKNQQGWYILSPLRPGEFPFSALNKTLFKANLPVVARKAPESGINTLLTRLTTWSQDNSNSKLLLVIDQCEELVTLCRSDTEREQFLNGLAEAISACPEQFRLVLTLSNDFEPQLSDTALKPYWISARFVVPAMTREELREAIVEPAAAKVMYFEPPTLVDELIDEVMQMPGALPLLSFTLSELYFKYIDSISQGTRSDRAMTQADYEDLGGVTRSLTQRADFEYDKLVKLDPAYGQIIKNVMLRMVVVDGGELARRRVFLSELEYPSDKNEQVQEVIRQFTKARLLVKGQDIEGNLYVEPAHDALVRGWQKLLVWKQQEQGSLILQRRLTPAAIEWNSQQPTAFHWSVDPRDWWKQFWDRQQQAKFLWHTNPRLDLLKQVLDSTDNWFNQVETEFVQRSIRQKRRNTNLLLTIGSGVILGLSGLTLAALSGQRNALIGQIRAFQQAAEANFVSNQQLDALINSLQAANMLKKWPWYLSWFKPENQVENAVKKTLQTAVYTVRERNRLQHSSQAANVSVRFSPDGQLLATAGDDHTIALWDVHGQQLKTWPIEEGWSIAFSPSDQLIATAGEKGIVRLWNFQGQKLDNWDTKIGWIRSISFSKDGRLLATAGLKGTVIWNLQDKSSVKLPGQNGVWSLNFSPNGQLVATTGLDRTVRLWNLKGKPVKNWGGYQNSLRSVNFSPNGKFLAIAGDLDSARLCKWQDNSCSNLKQTGVWSISFRPPKGQYLATAGFDGAVRLLDWQGNEKKILRSSGSLNQVSFSPNGNLLATAGDNGNIALWNLQGQQLVELKANQDKVKTVSFSSNSQILATTTDDGTVRWWNLQGEPIEGRREDAPPTNDSCNLKERGLQVRKGDENTMAGDKAFVYDWQNRYLAETEKGHPGGLESISCSVDGKLLATAGADGQVRLWDLQHLPLKKQNPKFLTLKKEWSGKQGWITFVQFSRDGKLLATGGEKSVHLWNIDGEHLATWETDQGRIKSISFSPDGKLLATVGDRGNPKLLPVESFDELMERGCNWVRDYLKTNPNVKQEDRHLCDLLAAALRYRSF